MKKVGLYSILIFLCVAQYASAATLTVRPFLIDETVEPRDIISRDITLTSDATHRIISYATVNEITLDNEGQIKEFASPVMTDRTNTVTSWVEISRARIELDPGESKTIPLTLRIHPYAEPGEYHFFIGFATAPNRPLAEAIALKGDADGVIVKVTVADTTSEALHISDFSVRRFVIGDTHRAIEVELENTGDAPSTPTGEIIFYDSRGEEVSSVEVNAEQQVIPSGEKIVIPTEIPFLNKLGRFKANLTLHYGENNKSSVFDVTQFYMMPYNILLIILFGIVCFSIFVTIMIKRVFDDERHDDDEHGKDIPLFVQTGREFKEVDHDINLTKS